LERGLLFDLLEQGLVPGAERVCVEGAKRWVFGLELEVWLPVGLLLKLSWFCLFVFSWAAG